MLNEANRTIYLMTDSGEVKVLDGRLYTFRGEWLDVGEPNGSMRATAAQSFYNAALSAEDNEEPERAAAYLAEVMRYGGIPWQAVPVFDEEGIEIRGDAKANFLREYRATGAMVGAWFANPEAASYKPLKVEQINWLGLPE